MHMLVYKLLPYRIQRLILTNKQLNSNCSEPVRLGALAFLRNSFVRQQDVSLSPAHL